MLRSIVRTFTVVSVAHGVARAVMFLYLVYAARILGPELFGQFLLVGTYVMFSGAAFMAGMLPVAIREFANERDDPRRVLEQVLSLRLVLGFAAYGTLICIVLGFLPAQTFLPLAAIAGSTLVIDAFRDSFTSYFMAIGRMAIPGAIQIAGAILTAASGTALLYMGYGIFSLFVAAAAVNVLIAIGWHFFFSTRLGRYRIRVDIGAWKAMFILVLPFTPVQFTVQLNRLLNVMMLSLVGGPVPRAQAVGFYGAAQQIANMPTTAVFLLRRVMIAPIARKLSLDGRVDEEFALALKTAAVFGSFPVLVAATIFAEEIFVFVFGARYLDSVAPFKILGSAAAISIMATFGEAFTFSYRESKPTRFFVGAVVPLLTNLVLCFVLIPAHGASGAALAFLAASFAHLGFSLYYCRILLLKDSLVFVRLLGPLAVLSASYAGCFFAAHSIQHGVLRVIAVVAIAACGVMVAGHRELGWLWAMTFRRARRSD